MAINKNHEFEELEGIKCAIVEKNVNAERVNFLKQLLTFNKYSVIVIPSPLPKTTATAQLPEGQVLADAPLPETFTVGVTDVVFNATNAVFGRLLKTQDNHIVTLAYWQQKEAISRDEIPYYENLL